MVESKPKMYDEFRGNFHQRKTLLVICLNQQSKCFRHSCQVNLHHIFYGKLYMITVNQSIDRVDPASCLLATLHYREIHVALVPRGV